MCNKEVHLLVIRTQMDSGFLSLGEACVENMSLSLPTSQLLFVVQSITRIESNYVQF